MVRVKDFDSGHLSDRVNFPSGESERDELLNFARDVPRLEPFRFGNGSQMNRSRSGNDIARERQRGSKLPPEIQNCVTDQGDDAEGKATDNL